MRLLHFVENGRTKLGIWTDSGVVDVAAAAARFGCDGELPSDAQDVISGGKEVLDALRRLQAMAMTAEYKDGIVLSEAGLKWAPSLTRPGKIVCVGLNYRRHAEETKMPIPESPILFHKFNNALNAHGEAVPLPPVTAEVDYEAELAVVIGRRAKYIEQNEALEYVFGYCAANDVSARDLQRRTSQWALGKCCDGFAPLGPYLVTADEVDDPNNLAIRCFVNGEQRQNSNTSDMIFSCDELVHYISQHMTLEPGDVILTGTPEGVVLGHPRDQRVYLQHGDTVTVEIEKLGALTNVMMAE